MLGWKGGGSREAPPLSLSLSAHLVRDVDEAVSLRHVRPNRRRSRDLAEAVRVQRRGPQLPQSRDWF